MPRVRNFIPILVIWVFLGGITLGTRGEYPKAAEAICTIAQTKMPSGEAIQYVSRRGNDSNDGQSWSTAKLTIFAACEGLPGGSTSPPTCGKGTIFFSSGVSSNPKSGAGLWLMGPGDPNYSSPPAGWLRGIGATVQFIGVGCQVSGANSKNGQCLVTGGSNADNGHPQIWLSGANSVSFYNWSGVAGSQNLRISIDSNGNRNGTTVGEANLFFENCNFGMGSAPATNGPTVDIGSNVFWVTFRDGVISANGNATAGSDLQSAITINPGTGAGAGLIYIEDVNINNGPIKFYPGANGGSLYVSNITSEATPSGHGAIWLTGTNNTTQFILTNIQVADSTAVACEVDGNGPADAVVAIGTICTGPATSLGYYEAALQGLSIVPSRAHQNGFVGGRMYGQVDNSRRGFSPTAIRYPNLAFTNPSSWGNLSPGTVAITTGVTAPDGTTGAATLTSNDGQASARFFDQNVSYAVGDYIIVGGWARSRNGAWSGGSAFQVFTTASGFVFNDISGFSYATNGATINGFIQGDCFGLNGSPSCQWDWYSHAYKLSAIGMNPAEFVFQGLADSTHPTDYYAPIFIHISAGTIDDNEVAEIATHLQTYSSSCAVGTICGLPGQTLSETFLIPNNGRAFAIDNVALSAGWGEKAKISSARGSAQRFTFTATASGTGITRDPRMTITFPTMWPVMPILMCKQTGGTGTLTAVSGEDGASTTRMTLTFNGTPASGSNYVFVCEGE